MKINYHTGHIKILHLMNEINERLFDVYDQQANELLMINNLFQGKLHPLIFNAVDFEILYRNISNMVNLH